MMIRFFSVLVLVSALSACFQTTPPPQRLPELTFKHLQPRSLSVARIEQVDQSQSTVTGKHIEHRFPTSPLAAMGQWQRDRLVATGLGGIAQFTILEASGVEEKLTKESGISGFFTNDQSERYQVKVHARLDFYDGTGKPAGFAEAQASRFITVSEDISLYDREKALLELTEKTMADFDKAMMAELDKIAR